MPGVPDGGGEKAVVGQLSWWGDEAVGRWGGGVVGNWTGWLRFDVPVPFPT